jgi:hypothetical protein
MRVEEPVGTDEVHAVLAGLGDQVLASSMSKLLRGNRNPLFAAVSSGSSTAVAVADRPSLTANTSSSFALHRMIQSGHHRQVVDHYGSSTSTRFPTAETSRCWGMPDATTARRPCRSVSFSSSCS